MYVVENFGKVEIKEDITTAQIIVEITTYHKKFSKDIPFSPIVYRTNKTQKAIVKAPSTITHIFEYNGKYPNKSWPFIIIQELKNDHQIIIPIQDNAIQIPTKNKVTSKKNLNIIQKNEKIFLTNQGNFHLNVFLISSFLFLSFNINAKQR